MAINNQEYQNLKTKRLVTLSKQTDGSVTYTITRYSTDGTIYTEIGTVDVLALNTNKDRLQSELDSINMLLNDCLAL